MSLLCGYWRDKINPFQGLGGINPPIPMLINSYNHKAVMTQRLYIIRNLLTAEFYVGKTQNPRKRWWQHRWNARNGVDTHLYRAMRKYGIENFEFELQDTTLTEEELIGELKPHYNMTRGGDGGDTSNSPKFKESMKKYHANKTRESYATYGSLGYKKTPEQCRRSAEAHWRPITIEGVTYPSHKHACEALGISRQTLARRYRGKNWG